MEVSIFNGGFVTYPTIFKKSKPAFDETLLTFKKFRLGPDRKKMGSINNLKMNIGIKVNEIPTFKTDFISGKEKFLYNGHYLILRVKNDDVYLEITEGKETLLLECWDLNELTKVWSIKNHNCGFITKDFVKGLIVSGRLQVKFNVWTDKNHGTDWRIK